MLQQKAPKSRNSTDRAICAEAVHLGNALKDLGKKLSVPTPLKELTDKKIDLSEGAIVEAAIVFLTDKKQGAAHKKVLQWIGIDTVLTDEAVFKGKINGILRFGEHSNFKMHLFHFDHLPILKLPDCKRALKIIVFDRAYCNKYDHLKLALQVLGLDSSVVLTIDISKEAITGEEPLQVKALYTGHYKLTNLKNSAKEVLCNETLVYHIQQARMLNYLNYIDLVLQLLKDVLDHKEKALHGKYMLLKKKQFQSEQRQAEVSSRDISLLKSNVDIGYKSISRYAEEQIEYFEKEHNGYKELERQITEFLGFVEEKQSRYVTLTISDGAIRDKMSKSHTLLSGFFNKLGEEINGRVEAIDSKIMNRFQKWELNAPKINSLDFGEQFTVEILNGNLKALPDKPLEKKITSKGFGNLLMELRTPLFMLMPFMMIFALFAALVGGEDKGHIDESILFHENRPAIAIDQLPEARNNEFRRFIKEVEENRGPRKGVFDKEIKGELVTEPQLATVLLESPQTYGNKVKLEETVAYHFDSKNQVIYLYLTENSDRNFVIKKLYDPAYKLLSIPESTRRGFGIGGLIRALSGLRDYRYLILIGLLSLVSWFIISRKRGMDMELRSAKNREQQKLNFDLKQFVDKSIKQSLGKWRSRLVDILSEKQQVLTKAIEKTIGSNADKRKLERLREKKIIQKKITVVKTEKSKLTTMRSELWKLASKQEQLHRKLRGSTRK